MVRTATPGNGPLDLAGWRVPFRPGVRKAFDEGLLRNIVNVIRGQPHGGRDLANPVDAWRIGHFSLAMPASVLFVPTYSSRVIHVLATQEQIHNLTLSRHCSIHCRNVA
jgi:hypothetical protein